MARNVENEIQEIELNVGSDAVTTHYTLNAGSDGVRNTAVRICGTFSKKKRLLTVIVALVILAIIIATITTLSKVRVIY